MLSAADGCVPVRNEILLRPTESADGPKVHALVAQQPALDSNSLYCNLLQTHFYSDTSAVALHQGEVVGFAIGLIPPSSPDQLFIWQVAVLPTHSGQGIARELILSILDRDQCKGIQFLTATITPSNVASWKLFEGLAKRLGVETDKQVLFDCEHHFSGAHESEVEIRIGPLTHSSEPSSGETCD